MSSKPRTLAHINTREEGMKKSLKERMGREGAERSPVKKSDGQGRGGMVPSEEE